MSLVKLFHSTGAATEKDLSANVLHFIDGITRKSRCFPNLRPEQLLHLVFSRSWRHLGLVLLMLLYVRTKILYSIHWVTGNQCSCLRHSVVLSILLFLSTKCAHMFWTLAASVEMFVVAHTVGNCSSWCVRCTDLGISWLLFGCPAAALFTFCAWSLALHFDISLWCDAYVSPESNHASRYQIMSVLGTKLPVTLMVSIVHLLTCLLYPK